MFDGPDRARDGLSKSARSRRRDRTRYSSLTPAGSCGSVFLATSRTAHAMNIPRDAVGFLTLKRAQACHGRILHRRANRFDARGGSRKRWLLGRRVCRVFAVGKGWVSRRAAGNHGSFRPHQRGSLPRDVRRDASSGSMCRRHRSRQHRCRRQVSFRRAARRNSMLRMEFPRIPRQGAYS